MPVVGSNPIFEIKLKQFYLQRNVLNVFHYRAIEGTAPTASAVANSFELQKVDAIISIQNSGLEHTAIEVIELTAVDNFIEVGLTGVIGELTGTSMAAFFASSFRYLRTTRETRGGWKRFAGLTEEVIDGNDFVATFETAAAAVATELAANMPVGILNLRPIILSPRYTALPVVNPLPVDEWVYNDVAGVQFVDRVTTQNTRKGF